MKTVPLPIDAFNPRQPIPGYVLRERIGAGGFGEVWSSDAPGGLTKAVKIVYGPMNASKAERELKALNRVKQVQHPLLLSLERIEVVDGHLVIVSELAEGSLHQRFQRRVEEGNTGIPRDELLGFMQDAAEALDYLYSQHSLQHLDVKPENLLLLANRVKVADFGMVKDLHEQSDTLIGGLTPLYAPPEVYDGKPNRHSDQYSLAIVYQQLLTAEPPFAGRTAAQLAAQHLHSEPNLSPLPDADRSIVGRALSKKPERRFENCMAFVNALKEARTSKSKKRRRAATSRDGGRVARKQRLESTVDETPLVTNLPLPADVETLPPLPEMDTESAVIPTLFIGAGSLAARTLGHLRRRLTSQFGSKEVPATRFLLLDTDANAVAKISRGDSDSSFRHNETVAMPIREASYYRQQADSFLEWIERRWLYNIPRTLCTEGIRPLGRLSFVDHFAAVDEALRVAISDVIDPEFVASSQEILGRPVAQNTLRVFVVSATTGGSGSGMVLDLAYAVRAILKELNISDERVLGLLVHSVTSQGRSRDVQIANSMACLRELACYSTHGSQYPGEPACGLPSFTENCAPFAHTYLVHLGQELSAREFDSQTAMLADFLYANSVSSAAPIFDQSRDSAPFESYEPGECRVRSFSMAQVCGDDERDSLATEYLCRMLIRRWLGDESREQLRPQEIVALAEKFALGLNLGLEKLIQRGQDMLGDGEVVASTADYLNQVLDVARAAAAAEPSDLRFQTMRETVDDLLAGHGQGRQLIGDGKSWLEKANLTFYNDATRRVTAFIDWFAMLAKQPKVRLRGVQRALTWSLENLARIEQQLVHVAEHRSAEAIAAIDNVRDPDFRKYAEIRLRQLSDRAQVCYVRTIYVQLQDYGELLRELCRRLDDLSVQFAVVDGPQLGEESEELELVSGRRWQLLVELDDALNELSLGTNMLLDPNNASSNFWSQLAPSLRQAARRIVANATARQKVSRLVIGAQDGNDELHREVAELLAQARPKLRCCGGQERALIIIPESTREKHPALPTLLAQNELQQATLVSSDEERIAVCYEMNGVPLENVVSQLSFGRRQFFELADRLQSRIDVDWDRSKRTIVPGNTEVV